MFVSQKSSVTRSTLRQAIESLEGRRLFAYTYTLTDLAPGVAGQPSPTGVAYGISDNGYVAMGVNGHAAVWKSGVLTDLGFSGYATDVNDSGTVVGVDTTGGTNKPFIYSNGVEKLLTYQTRTTGIASAINQSGAVVGTFYKNANSPRDIGFLYSEGSIGSIGAPAGLASDDIRATGINAGGQIIGNASDPTTGQHQAFFDNVGSFTLAKAVPGSTSNSTQHGITDGGFMAYYGASTDLYTDGTTKIYHVYVTTADPQGSRDDYGTLGNDYDIAATDINSLGEITATIDGGATPFEAAISSGGYGFTSLNSEIDPATGWSLFAANAINNSSQIVGYGYDADGNMKPYLLTKTPQSTVQGYVFNDLNKDRLRGENEPLAPSGVTVFLDANDNGQLDAGELSVKTNSDGYYKFDALPGGSYHIGIQLPANQYMTNVDDGKTTYAFGLDSKENFYINLGYATKAAPVTGSISGVLFNDSNNNGKFDRGETATGVRTVFIDANGNGVLDRGEISTLSDAAGKYTFNNVAPGKVNIARVFPSGYQLSNPVGNSRFDVTTTVVAGQISTVNLGTHEIIIPPAGKFGSISGTLFNDSNNNGKQDKSEVGSGVRTVFFDDNKNGKLDAGEPSTQSDAAGHYSFNRVLIGSHAISRVFPVGYHLSNPSAGTGGKDLLVNVIANTDTVANLGTHEDAVA